MAVGKPLLGRKRNSSLPLTWPSSAINVVLLNEKVGLWTREAGTAPSSTATSRARTPKARKATNWQRASKLASNDGDGCGGEPPRTLVGTNCCYK